MYKIKLEHEGYQVFTAKNGRSGLELLQQVRPDVTLLDIMMPEMNGDEMLEKLRQTDWGKRLKVVVLTNVGESEIAANIESLGIAGLIIKAQSTPSDVVKKIRSLLTNA